MHPEITNNPPELTDSPQGNPCKLSKPDKPCHKRSERVSSFIFYLSILFFIIGFNFSDIMVGNWYQQFMPNIGGRTISDIFFLDSLTGWAVTPFTVQNDTTFVLKTTNGGDNWTKQFAGIGQFVGRNKIKFINSNTGFTCGNDHFTGSTKITKTTNGGNSWFSINNPPTTAVFDDMSVLNEDTIWLVASSGLTGGVFFTSNGGLNWQPQFSGGNQNPNKIYMYNARIGFMSNNSASPNIYRTTNGGGNWTVSVNGDWFNDIKFADSLTGWYSNVNGIYKTTNEGNNWQVQVIPTGPNIIQTGIPKLSVLNKDTIWAAGNAIFYPNSQIRGILLRTINGGDNWLYQIPDTSIKIVLYYSVQFIDKNNGWAYNTSRGIHTTTGGDPVWITPIEQISTEVPKEFKLYQNYPNPFNPTTNIKYQIISNVKSQTSNVKLIVYDIQGKQITELVNQKQTAGTYEVDFIGGNYSSGVYFYSLIVEGNVMDTKRMVLVK